MRSRKTNQLVANARNHRHQHNTGSNALEQAGPAQKGKDEHADEHDDHQKVGATAWMQGAEGAHIFDLQGQSCLVGINGFMLRPMVLENALDRSITQCYALEGSYPPSLSYLVENYGLTYNSEQYFIDYQYIGSNLRPDTMIIERDGLYD